MYSCEKTRQQSNGHFTGLAASPQRSPQKITKSLTNNGAEFV